MANLSERLRDRAKFCLAKNYTQSAEAMLEAAAILDRLTVEGLAGVADAARPFESPFTSAVDAAPTAPTSDIEDALLSALCAMVTRYVELANSGDAGNWDPEIIPDVINARAAIMLALTDGRPNGRSTPDASPAHENPSNVEKQA